MRLIGASTEVFLSKGYKRTQMMGLSAGTIYRYVESKEALFDLVVRAGAGMKLEAGELAPPIATPGPGATMAFLRKTLKREGRIACLDEALGRPKVDDAAGEFAGIVRELYAKTVQFRVGIKLLDRSGWTGRSWPRCGRGIGARHWWTNFRAISTYGSHNDCCFPCPTQKHGAGSLWRLWPFLRCIATTIPFQRS